MQVSFFWGGLSKNKDHRSLDMWDPLKIDTRNHNNVYFCRYRTRVDYIYCNENVRKEWLPVAVEHFDVVSFTNLLAASGLVKLTKPEMLCQDLCLVTCR